MSFTTQYMMPTTKPTTKKTPSKKPAPKKTTKTAAPKTTKVAAATTPAANTKSGLAIASFVTAIVGVILILTVIGAVIGIPAVIVALVLGIVALVQKQRKRGLAIAGVVISALAIVGLVIAGLFVGKFVGPTIDFAQQVETLIEQDPELQTIFEDPNIDSYVELYLKQNIENGKVARLNDEAYRDARIEEVGMQQGMMEVYQEVLSYIIENKDDFKKFYTETKQQ